MSLGAGPLQVLRDAWISDSLAASETAGPAAAGIRAKQSRIAALALTVWLVGLLPPSMANPQTAVVTVCVIAVWAATIIMRPRETLALTAVITSVAVAVLFLTEGGVGQPDTPLASAWFDAAAASAGLGLATVRRATLGVCVVALAELVGWSAVAAGGNLPGGWRTATAWPVASIGTGIALAATVAIARRSAQRLDHVAAAARSAVREEEILAFARKRLRDFTRLLHDTAINTLGVVGQGLPAGAEVRLRDRCRHDLDLLERADPDAPDDLVAALRERAAAIGIELLVRGDPGLVADAPTPVRSAAAAALREALLNVAKHSGSRTAALEFGSVEGRVGVELSDDGIGWPGDLAAGDGIAESIIGRCSEAGIRVTIDGSPHRGAVVRLLFPERTAPPDPDGILSVELASIGLAASLSIVAETLGRTLLGWGLFPISGSVAAWAVLVAALALAWAVRSGRLVPRATAWAVLVAVGWPVVLWMPAQAVGSLSWGWWATIASLPIFAAILLLDGPWWVLGLAYGCMMGARVADDEYPAQIVFPAVVSLALGAGVLWVLRRRYYVAARRYASEATALLHRRARTVSAASAQQSGTRELHLLTAPARDALREMADGSRDPRDPDVMSWCTAEARHLRNVSRLGGLIADADLGLLSVITRAHALGLALRVTADPSTAFPVQPARASLGRAMAALQLEPVTGGCALTILTGADEATLVVVAESPEDLLPPDALAELSGSGVTVEQTRVEASVSLELSWPVARDAPPAAAPRASPAS